MEVLCFVFVICELSSLIFCHLSVVVIPIQLEVFHNMKQNGNIHER